MLYLYEIKKIIDQLALICDQNGNSIFDSPLKNTNY